MANKPVKKRKKKSKMYFGQPAQDAIMDYLNCPKTSEGDKERNQIYNERIKYPFEKLAENIIHTFKFYNFDYDSESVKHEVVSFMVMNMHKFNPDKGRAFSYFSIVAKNYLILHNNNNYKRYKTHSDITAIKTIKESGLGKTYIEDPQSTNSVDDFFEQMLNYFDINLTDMFKKRNDIAIADAVLTLMKNRENIENFNKKSLYILIREMTNANTQQITKVINIIKKRYVKLLYEYDTKGDIQIIKPSGSAFLT
tara:strand:+ start:2271 stop:3029 length:759 start_codon:yes stop_codon:yes gene_type:complete